jgi:hypothetical protein
MEREIMKKQTIKPTASVEELEQIVDYSHFIDFCKERKVEEKEFYDLWKAVRDEFLREKLHKQDRFMASADGACLLLIDTKSLSEIRLRTGSDGMIYVAFVEDENEVPSYYRFVDVYLKGEFAIMGHDYAKIESKDKITINGDYNVYRAGNSFIFMKVNY